MATLLGVLFIVLGLVAIVEPLIAGLAIAVLAGWLLILGGVVHAVSAFRGSGGRRTVWHVLLAVLYLVGGTYFLTHPLLGLSTLTLLLATILLIERVVCIVPSVQTRP